MIATGDYFSYMPTTSQKYIKSCEKIYAGAMKDKVAHHQINQRVSVLVDSAYANIGEMLDIVHVSSLRCFIVKLLNFYTLHLLSMP